MAYIQQWRVWILSLLGLLSFSLSHALAVLPEVNGESLSTSHKPLTLEKRAPRPLYSQREHQLCRHIAERIDSLLVDRDVVYFIGNSGAYIGYAFDKSQYNMKEIPASNTRQYRNPILATYQGGASVDGWFLAFLDSVSARWGRTEGDAGGDWANSEPAKAARAYYESIPRFLINIVDYDRRLDGPRPAIPPKYVDVLDTITVGGSGEVNRLVGDKKAHDRVTLDYPPTKWDIPIKNSWASANEQSYATLMKNDIINWNKQNGGLIGSPDPKTKLPKKKKPSILQKFFNFPANSGKAPK